MRSSRLLVAATCAALWLPLARAQDAPEELDRLRAENAVLRLELRALLERLARLEEKAKQWPDASAHVPGGGAARSVVLTDDGGDLLLSHVRLADDAGAMTPEELARVLHAELAGLADDPAAADEALREVAGRLGAFAPDGDHAFLVPRPLWAKAAAGDEPQVPVEGDLLVQLGELLPALRGSALVGVELEGPASAGAARDASRDAVTAFGITGHDSGFKNGVDVSTVLAGTLAQRLGLTGDDLLQSLVVVADGAEKAYAVPDLPALERALRAVPRGSPVRVGTTRPQVNTYGGYERRAWLSETARLDLPGIGDEAGPKTGAASQPPVRRVRLHAAGPLGRVELRVSAVRVNGRWLIAAVRTSWFERRAWSLLEAIDEHARRAQAPLDGVDQALLSFLRARGFTEVRALGASHLAAPYYRVEVVALPDDEHGARAKPLGRAYRSFLTGPWPGEHDPLKNPYRVRNEE